MASSAKKKAKIVWLLSFGDVVTLMITFFILLIAVNKGEITKTQQWGVHQLEQSYLWLQKSVHERFSQQGVTPSALKFIYGLEGIKIIIQSDQAFRKGDYQPLPPLQEQIDLLGQILQDLPLLSLKKNPETAKVIQAIEAKGYEWRMEIDVAGHTDNDPVDPRSPLRNNWILSTLRAQTVAQLLSESSNLPPSLFSVSGYGEYQPIVPNDTPEHKAMNRRVEVVITAYFQKRLAPAAETAEKESP